MSCVNINSQDYKDLVKGLDKRQKFVAKAVISKYMTDNNTTTLPDFITLKTLMSDLYNTNKSGVDYQEFYGEVKSMFRSLLPSMSDKDIEERVKFVDKLELMRLRNGKQVLSSFIKDTVYIANSISEERGEKAYTDVRHEVFHVIFNNFLSESEQEDIMLSFKRWKPKYSSIQDKEELEERMADEFETYKSEKSKVLPILIRDFFQKVLKFLGFIGDNYNDIIKLFDDVNNGKFTRNYIKDSLVTRDKSILSYTIFSTDLDLFLQAKAFVLNNLNELMFPSDNKNLSETANASLFLDINYRSPLFQNNKEVFKLGLSKADALKKLQSRIKAIKDSQTLDPQLSKVIDALTTKGVLKAMYDYLQPYSLAEVGKDGELVLKNQIERDPTEILLESDEDYNSLEIGSKELINPTTKISEVVKDFLSSITYETTPGNFVNIDPGAGFIALLNMLNSLYGSTSLEENLKQIKDNYKPIGNQSKAVFNKVKQLHESVIASNRISLNIKGVSDADLTSLKQSLSEFNIPNEDFKGVLNIIIPENIKIENQGTNSDDNRVVFTFNRVKEGEISFLLRQEEGESNKTFIERVSKITGIPNFIISKLFQYNEQRNQVAELTKVANSLRRLSPKFVRVSTQRINDPDLNLSGEFTSYAFIDKVTEYKNSTSLASDVRDRLEATSIRKDVVSLMDTYKSVKDKGDKKQLRNLLHNIVVNKLSAITEPDFLRISDKDVTILLNSLNRLLEQVPDIRTTKLSTEFSNSDVYLRITSKFSNLLTNYTFEKNNPTSFSVSTSNKQKWGNVMSNTSYKIFKNLEDFATGLINKDRLLPYLKNSFNNYLRYNPIFTHNHSTGEVIVNENLLKVGEDDFYSDHQETYFDNRDAFYEKPPIPFSKESPRDWINRNFLAMFQLPVLEAGVGNKNTERSGLSYFQQKFQPESAPNVSVIKMGINSAEELENSIMSMIIQEAHMNYLAGGSIRGNLVKHTKKSTLPGLEGGTHFIKDGINIFFNSDGTLNKEFGQISNGKLIINKNNKTLLNLTKTIINNLDASLGQFTDLAITEKATLVGTDLSEMYNKLKNSYLKSYQLSDSEISTLKGIGINAKTDIESMKSEDNFEIQRAILKKALSVYYFNSYVNGFFMNQLSSGATQNYKNPLDEIKRQAGVNAMNDTGLIDDKHGIKSSYRNVVISAANNFYGQTHKLGKIPLLERFFKNKKQEIGDAQSWDLPEYKQMLRKSFGKSVDIGNITKDVHFEVNEQGGVDYRKTSSAELTNEVVKKNKTLRDLRFAMTFQRYLKSLSTEDKARIEPRIKELYDKLVDNNGLRDVNEYMEYQNFLEDVDPFMIHKASFESAIKGSKPSNMSKFVKNQETGTFDFNLEESSILTLNSAYNGIQQAIRHRYIDSFISHFTQLTYLIGLNRTETSIKNNRQITRTLSKFAKSGMFDTLFDYRMSYDKTDKTLKANNRSKKEFIEDLKKKLDLPGNERILGLLNIPNISMNNPLFSEKLMQSFFNSFTKKTVSPKHPGGSFVLQSEFGFEANRVLSENSMRVPEMVTDDKGNVLYAECYLPEMYSDQLKKGELIYYNSEEYNKMFGFRIPSSDLHSSVPLRVIGYYPSSSHDNVIVIPSAVTALHGSDFDVDKLFVVRYGVFGMKDEDKDPKTVDKTEEEIITDKIEYKTRFQKDNKIIAQKGIKFGYTAPAATYDSGGRILSFGQDDKHTEIFALDFILISEKQSTEEKILSLEDDITEKDKQSTSSKAENMIKSRERRELVSKVDDLTKHLKVIRSIQKGLYSNTILDAVLDNISYSGENAPDIFFGITFDPVKGYEENSEYSQLALVFSNINKANNVEDILPERPILYKFLEEADQDLVTRISKELSEELGVDIETEDGKKDLLAMVNESLKEDWVNDRDEFIRRQRGAGSVNINKVEQHVNVHKETYMAAGLVGLVANFSKGLAYAFHGLTEGSSIELALSDKEIVEIDGQKFTTLNLVNRDNIKTQEIRSLALNAAIDHVKEQILNVLNVGNNTAKIFLAAVSTEMNLHQTTMLMLQPVAKELNSSNATTIMKTLGVLEEAILEKFKQLNINISQEEFDKFEIKTKNIEKFIQTSFNDLMKDTENPNYKENLMTQLKIIKQLATLNKIGQEVSDVSAALSIVQGLPYNLESAYDKLKAMDKFIDIEKFFNKLTYTEKSEYTENGFKDDLKSSKTIFKNVNLANNENVLGALESIKVQIDVASEMFAENSVQAQFLVNNMIKAVSNNSDPSTMFTGENDQNLTFDTVKNMSISDKYLKGKNTFNIFKIISRNIFNYLTSGLNISYNKDNNLMSLGIQGQKLTTIKKDDKEYQLGTIKSFLNSFLMKMDEAYDSTKNYDGNNFLVSQINPDWRIKPLTVIKKQNSDNRFLKGIGVDTNFRDKVRIMTFNSSLTNTPENLAEIEQAVHELNNLNSIYVRLDKKGRWVDVPSSLHPETNEMNEIVFNILKSSLYTDKFKFSSTKATNVIPPIYFQKIFRSSDTLVRDLILWNVADNGNKYYKDFSNLENQGNERSALSDIKENLFINTILSIPTVLPNLGSLLKGTGKRQWQSGILPNGNIYDLFFEAGILDKKEDQEEGSSVLTSEKTDENTNIEVDQDLSEAQAESDLFEKFRKNPSFVVNEPFSDGKKLNRYEIFMKVGSTGSKETGDLLYYYKKIATVDGKLTNNSFDPNLLINNYKIKDYYNPKRLAVPVRGVDFSADKVVLKDVKISSFLITSSDNDKTKNENKEAIKASQEQQFQSFRDAPENKFLTDDQVRAKIKTKINVENIINQVNEISLYDSRNLDRVGVRNFQVLSKQISGDKTTVTLELQALPKNQQIRFNKFDAPFEVLKTLRKKDLSIDEKIKMINSTPGVAPVTTSQNLTPAQIEDAYNRAAEINEEKEINKVLKQKSCK
jgi:hypothetical protein